MKKLRQQTLKVSYEFVPSDPAEEKTVAQGLDRAFDVLFEAVLKAESDARKTASNIQAKQGSFGIGIHA
jgi:hypothetical protein